MIHNALLYVRDLLNEQFKREFSISESKVVLSNLMNSAGSEEPDTDGKIVFFLMSLEEESTLKNNMNRSSINNMAAYTHSNASLHLNLHLMFCANFSGKNYPEGLRYLSSIIRFFQSNNKLSSIKNSDSDHQQQLKFELSKLNFNELSHVWSAIGSKITPFVMYKARLVVIDDTSISKTIPSIKISGN